ncbi:MAG: LysR family transcriptional regulator, partial [Oceanospirillaceae bacterium]|nr:LysR family transcriptional regulator [Oceanospirillaceae bacterium]
DAGNALGVSQPAASKAIQRSEALLGVALICRNVRPIKLTHEGELVAEFAKKQHDLETALYQRLQSIKKSGADTIRIASFGPSASTHLLPNIVAQLRGYLSELDVSILELNELESIKALDDGLVDFATVVQIKESNLDCIPLENDQLVALVPADSSLAQQASLSAKKLSQENFIMTKGGSETLIRDWYAQSDLEPRVKHTAMQLTSIFGMIRAGMGVSIIAKMAMPETHPSVIAVPLSPVQPRVICMAKSDKDFNSHTAQRVWQLLQRFNK